MLVIMVGVPKFMDSIYASKLSFLNGGIDMMDGKTKWFFFILVTAWLFIALAATILLILITHSAFSVIVGTLTAPPTAMIRHLYRYYFPLPSTRAVRKKQAPPP